MTSNETNPNWMIDAPNLKDQNETNVTTPSFQKSVDKWSSDTYTPTNSQSQTATQATKDNLLQQGGRWAAHSLYGGLVRPTLGLANLGTELVNGGWQWLGGKSNLNYYTNEALNKADELDRDLDRGKEDWASSDSLASTLGSWASLLIPIGGELKLADKAADVGKRLLDRDTYDKEQAIKNSFNKIKKAISSPTDDGLMKNKKLNEELDNLNQLYQRKADMEAANASDPKLDGMINKSKENIQTLTSQASNIADKQENINNVVSQELDNIEKHSKDLNPNLASTLIDYGITGRKGKGIIPAAVMGAAYGAGESSNKDSLTQVQNAIDGATLGGASTVILHHLANGGTNFFRYFKMPSTTENPQLSDAQVNNIKKIEDTPSALSKTQISANTKELGNNFTPNVQYLQDMQKYAKSTPQSALNITKNTQDPKKASYYQNLKRIVRNANVQNHNLGDTLTGMNGLKLTSNQLSNDAPLWKRLIGLSSGYPENAQEYSYNSQWNSFIPAMMRITQYPNLSTHTADLDFLNKDLQNAYDYAIQNNYEHPLDDHSEKYLDYINKNRSSIKDKNAEIQSLLDLDIKSRKAYQILDDSVKELNKRVPNDKELPSLDKLKADLNDSNISPPVKSRIIEELDKTGDVETAISNLRKSHALYNTSSHDQLENKILNHQNELATQTSEKFSGKDISIYNLNQYKDRIKDIGEDQHDSQSRDIYHNLAKDILPTFTKIQDAIYTNYLKSKDKDGTPLAAFSSGEAGKGNVQSITKIIRNLHDNLESGQAVHELLKDSGYGDINDVSKLTQSAVNEHASMIDQGVDKFINKIKKLSEEGNTNAIKLIKDYGDNLQNLRSNFTTLSEYASKKVGTQNANNNTIDDEARAAIIGAAPDIRKYEEQQKEDDRRIKAQIDYIKNQALFNGLSKSRNPLAGFKNGFIHGLKHVWAVAGVHNGKLDTYMDTNAKNLLSPNEDKPNNSAITQARSQLVSFYRPVYVNHLFGGKKLADNIRNIDENTLVPMHEINKDGVKTVKYVPLKDIKHSYDLEQAIHDIYQTAENITNNQKHVKKNVRDMQSTANENLNKNYQKLGALHYLLPRSVLSVPTLTGSLYPAYYNFLQSRSELQNNNNNNKNK